MAHPTYSKTVLSYELPEAKADRVRLDELSAQIKELTTIRTLSMDQILEAGQLILEAKKLLKSGEFYKWIKLETGVSHQKVYTILYVQRLVDYREELANVSPTIIYTLAAPKLPQEALDKVLDLLAAGKRLRISDVKDIEAETLYK